MSAPKHWYTRDYLPHFDRPGLIQALTFRLHDSMPAQVLERWAAELRSLPIDDQDVERRKRIAAYLDAGHGACFLREPRIAELVENALKHFHDRRYRLLAWVIMPNHVHLLLELWEGWPLPSLIQSWKRWTANRANQLLSRTGTFWAREFHDRYIRDAQHFANARRYIEQNPVKAALCRTPQEWRWSSARPPAQST
jgi:REP element-mobilizing transposase RayT